MTEATPQAVRDEVKAFLAEEWDPDLTRRGVVAAPLRRPLGRPDLARVGARSWLAG